MNSTTKILLGEKAFKGGYNTSNTISINLENTYKNLQDSTGVGNLSEYEQYLSEKDNSDRYRFVFTIKPFCSNVLFNSISEIVYKEGSDECIFFGTNGASRGITNDEDIHKTLLSYEKYKGAYSLDGSKLTRYNLIKDTGYSNASIGPLVYHCGYDIFNNHTLRQTEFTVVNKLDANILSAERKNFNTIKDYIRDYTGIKHEEYDKRLDTNGYKSSNVKVSPHLYMYDSIKRFSDVIVESTEENNGWFGFINQGTIDILNYVTDDVSVSLNKTMNNNKIGEQIDFYPDRTLYSFIPKINKYRHRIEKNWEYCITYPYKCDYDNELVFDNEHNINGLECVLNTNLEDYMEIDDEVIDTMEGKTLLFNTFVTHNLQVNDKIYMYFVVEDSEGNDWVIKSDFPLIVFGTGYNNENVNYYFSVAYDDIESILTNEEFTIKSIRFRKIVNNCECKYYFRKFKRLPNFKNTKVYSDGIVTNEEIEEYCLNDFSTNLNNLGFSKTIYSDDVAQIVFNDDVVTSGIKDNLGRNLSELYLTIVKTNYGKDKWYKEKKYTDESIEYSHCFGKVSSGLDLPLGIKDYNIHSIHDVDIENETNMNEFRVMGLLRTDDEGNLIKASGKRIDDDIQITGCNGNKDGVFTGDLVEFSPYTIEETVLEDIYFRFNTMQREYTYDNEFKDMLYDEITFDDGDISGDEFSIEQRKYNKASTLDGNVDYFANIFPEGYYYKAHYRVPIHEFNSGINQSKHTEIGYTLIESGVTDNVYTYVIKTTKTYYLNINDTLYFYDILNKGKRKTGKVVNVEGTLFNKITIVSEEVPDISKYYVYKPNSTMPNGSFELDETMPGNFIWRDMKKASEITSDSELYDSIFTNGAHYFTKNIMFYLKRQDGTGDFGLSYKMDEDVSERIKKLEIEGKYKNLDSEEYIDEEDSTCITF